MASKNAVLVLEDGSVYKGTSIGSKGTTQGEAVFSTCMTGYQEMLTDPSFAGQLLTLTYPLIGNYGIAPQDFESKKVQVSGFIIRQICGEPSNWRCKESLDEFLSNQKVIGIQGIDTRALTKHLRTRGVMRGAISTEAYPDELVKMIIDSPDYGNIDFVKHVSTDEIYVWNKDDLSADVKYDIGLIDLGVKYNIIRSLSSLGCRVTVYPCDTPADAILKNNHHGVVISPGPGDPALLDYVMEPINGLIGKLPIMGICLGHQLLGRAFGFNTFKLGFGHRGGNHPVKDLSSGRVYITSQNHGYAVDPSSKSNSALEVSQINLNDGTVEGLKHKELPIYSIQYHPEASPGPTDSRYLFGDFLNMIERSGV